MNRPWSALACVVSLASCPSLGCSKATTTDEGSQAPAVASPAVASPAAGSKGSGDGSGSSIANAMGVGLGASVTFSVPCTGSLFLGPFAFSKDPERVTFQSKATPTAPEQLCLGGAWVDRTAAFLAPAGFGCVEGTGTVEMTSEFEYSPGNGGHGANPVYFEVKAPEGQVAGCKAPTVTLTRK